MNPRLALAGCTALLFVITGCGQPGSKAPTPAEANAGFDAFVKAAARKSAAELNPDELKEAINQYVAMQVAAEAALKQGIEKDPLVKSQLDLTRTNVLSESLLQRYLEANPVTDAEIQAEYDTQVAATPSEYQARHILVDDKSLAEAIIQKLDAKGDFAALAKEYSKDSSAQNGGDLGWFSPQTMVPEFSAAVVGLEKGKFTATPVQTQFGWHVIQLEDVRAPQLPPLDQVRDRVQQMVQRKKVAAHLQELRKESAIDGEKLAADLTAYAQAPAITPVEPPADTAGAAPAEPSGDAATP